MPTNYVSKVEGLDQLLARLRGLPTELQQKVLGTAVRKAIVPMRDRAVSMAPRRTGKLAAAIIIARDRKPQLQNLAARYVVFVKYTGAAAAKYWRFLEFGTSKMAAQPFMRPAFIAESPTATSTMISEVVLGMSKLK